jgi:uncharacterized protein YutE (UPF0331/DUF86 family)
MEPFVHRLEAADRLNLILNRVGFALWQIQELESVAANYFVLLVQAEKGMGLEAGNLLIEKAKKKTFGTTVRRLAEAGLLTPQLERRLKDLLAERNWLVHGSREASRSAPYPTQRTPPLHFHWNSPERPVATVASNCEPLLALLAQILCQQQPARSDNPTSRNVIGMCPGHIPAHPTDIQRFRS